MKRNTRHAVGARLVLVSATALFLSACGDTDDGAPGDCPAGQALVDGRCEAVGGRDIGRNPDAGDTGGDPAVDLPATCAPPERICSDSRTAAVCDDSGSFVLEACTADEICSNGSCIDSGLACSPGVNIGCDDADSYRLCDDSGTGYDVVDCPAETPNCLGVGQCSAGICLTGQTRCSFEGETDAVERCADDGSEWLFDGACEEGLTCDAGACLSPCEENAKLTSFLGCDYWAVDLDNVDDAGAQQFSVSVSNPNEDSVTVTIRNMATSAVTTETVGPSTVRGINLDRLDVDGTGRTRNAYHITTDLPVTMHQFNPANNVGVFSNDASLLLPTNSAGQHYVVLGWPTGPFDIADFAHAYATVIAVFADGPTNVRVTASVDVTAGGGVNAMPAGELREVQLQFGDVLNLQTRGENGRDLSGTIIEADAPILVFAGHECAFVPDEDPTPFCDHMEQQLYPVEAWGTRYFGAKLSPRGTEIDVWRVVTAEPDTVLTTRPAVSGVNGRTIQPGEVLEFQTNQSFELEASAPVLLGQFMTGSNFPGIPSTCWQPVISGLCNPGSCTFGTQCTSEGECAFACSGNSDCLGLIPGREVPCQEGYCQVGTGVGDPAFMLAVPVQQYRDNYIFLTPADYRDDFFTVVAPIGTELTLDGEPILASALAPIADTGFGVYYHDVSSDSPDSDPAQAHTLAGSRDFALQVYGYDCDVSYAYPGGLNLEAEE